MKNKIKRFALGAGLVLLGITLATGTMYAVGKWKGTPNVGMTHKHLDEIENIIYDLKNSNTDDVKYYEERIKELTDLFNEANRLIAQRDDTINELLGMINDRDNTINELTRIINELDEELEHAYNDVLGIEARVDKIVKENK